MSEKQKFSDRLNEALDEAGFPESGKGRQSSIAEQLDDTVVNVGLWLEGDEYPRTSVLVKLAKLLKVQSNWLLSGTGDRYVDEQAEIRYKAQLKEQLAANKRRLNGESGLDVSSNEGLSKDSLALACNYMKLSKDGQSEVQYLMKQLLNDKTKQSSGSS